MTIILGCLSTMIICTYTVTHPSLPLLPPGRRGSQGTLSWSRWGWTKIVTISNFIFTLMAPEGAVVEAFRQHTAARKDVEFMHAHGYPAWTLKHSFFAQMRGLRTADHRVCLSGQQLHMRVPEQLTQDCLENILDEIADKEKADALAKAFSVWQLLRFVFGIVARGADRVPITPLEFVTCAYIPHTLVTFYFYMKKPYRVQKPIYVGPQPVRNDQERDMGDLKDMDSAVDGTISIFGTMSEKGASLAFAAIQPRRPRY